MIDTLKASDRQIAEYVARFRTPPGFNWKPLADDIETLLKMRPRLTNGKGENR